MIKCPLGSFIVDQQEKAKYHSGQLSLSNSKDATDQDHRHSTRDRTPPIDTICIFCGQLGNTPLHHVLTISHDENAKLGIEILKDYRNYD